MPRTIPFILTFCLAVVLASPAHGWSSHGHRVVGHLADFELTEAAREAVLDLLEAGESLGSVGPWADWVREEREETAPLHYINGPTDCLYLSESDYALPQGNVYSAVLGYAEQLANPELPRSQRAEALKFLVHFIGDLHQPLHTGFAEDRGGNAVAVVYRDEVISLHRYWDRYILDRHTRRFDPRAFAGYLQARFSDDERRRWAAVDNPRDWVIESRGYIFAGLYGMPRTDAGIDDAEGPMPVLDEAYRAVWLPVAEHQLARAGTRLAAMLNTIFETRSSPFERPPIDFPPAAP